MPTKKKATRKNAPAKVKKETPAPDNPYISPTFWKVMWGICGTTVVLEFFIHRHEHFKKLEASVLADMSNWFGFYGMFGLLACSGCILLAKGLSVFLKAKEDYYDDTP